MKRLILIFIAQCVLLPAFAQRKGNFGIFFGGSYYMGDINYTKHFYRPSLAGGVFYRHDFNDRHSAKMSLYYGSLKADFNDFQDSYRSRRGTIPPMSSTVTELALMYEFNFLPFNAKRKKENFTPYISAGAGYSMFQGTRGVNHFIIPMGVGARYNISSRMGVGCFWEMRMLFRDDIDGVLNMGEETDTPAKDNTTNFNNNDFYNFFGAYLTFKLFKYFDDCPAYDDVTRW